MSESKHVVLAFSGGLDTSFCVPYLIDKGYEVTTLFVDSGGVTEEDIQRIEQRAMELGAAKHDTISIASELWDSVITPLLWSGRWYQNQYPLLCSDRYLIVEACLNYCREQGHRNFAHGCTGMGNDQVRFDLAAQCQGDFNIISPIREIQKLTSDVREYEMDFLRKRGFEVSDKVSRYSVNENLMGATISGSEIDLWQVPARDSHVLTRPSAERKTESEMIKIGFENGQVISYNGKSIDTELSGEQLIQILNEKGGEYGIGRAIYTGDTTIGLKGRIVFEAPAIEILHVAHTALEHCVLSKAQNRFKSQVADKWVELVYEGLFYEPLKDDLEAFLASNQQAVTGTVTVDLSAGQALAVAVESDNILKDTGAVYAQSAGWTIDEAVGFIKLFGKSTVMAARRGKEH
jgi:argininosuccinate synthase